MGTESASAEIFSLSPQKNKVSEKKSGKKGRKKKMKKRIKEVN